MGFTQVALWNGISLRSKPYIPVGRGEWPEGLWYWGDVIQKQGNRDRNRKWLLPNSPIFYLGPVLGHCLFLFVTVLN